MHVIGHNHRKAKKRIIKNLIIGCLVITFFLTVGYSAFQTVINISAKGNIKIRTDFYVSSNGSDISGKGSLKSPYASIQKAYDSITKSPAVINVMNDITQVDTITMSENKDVTLVSYGSNANSIIRDNSSTGNLILFTDGKLKLQNIIIDGNNIEVSGAMLLKLDGFAQLTMESGAILKNAKNTGSGSAILLNNDSSLTMNDGEISNNYSSRGGAAIFMNSDGTLFTMNGGSIINNNGNDSVGAWSKGSIIINNGTISYNTAVNQAGAIQCYKSLVMNGGTISYNTAGTTGGAVNLTSTCQFTMSGGVISNNTSATGYVFAGSGSFTYNSGIICENIKTSNYETHTTCPS